MKITIGCIFALFVGASSIIGPVVGAQTPASERANSKTRFLTSEEKERFVTAKKEAEAKIAALVVAHRISGDVSFYLSERPLLMVSQESSGERVLFQIHARILNPNGAKWYLDGNRKDVFAAVEECWTGSLRQNGFSPLGVGIVVDRGAS